ncbi:hypothetical protein PLICRDRAFT_214728 [Plicaturopsis crispa FD-325 SS-3]|nr:hypothetical protein PLICRDRAFT_214728 [Plicaturopsis crispa FD-325 SS-3]
MHFHLPVSLVVFSSFFVPAVLAQSSQSSSFASTTGSASATKTSASASGSVNASSSASATSSASYPSLSGYSTCVTNCLSIAVSNANCTSVTDVNCYCARNGRTKFTNGLVDCISGQCPSELNSSESLSQQFCDIASTSVSLSFTSPPASSSSSSSSKSSSTSPSSSSTASATSTSNAAVGTAHWDVGSQLLGALSISALAMAVGAICI